MLVRALDMLVIHTVSLLSCFLLWFQAWLLISDHQKTSPAKVYVTFKISTKIAMFEWGAYREHVVYLIHGHILDTKSQHRELENLKLFHQINDQLREFT